jgi:hypothetical protein
MIARSLKLIIASVGLCALSLGCNNKNPSQTTTASTAKQVRSSDSSSKEQAPSPNALHDTAAELHTQSTMLMGSSESQYRQSLGRSLDLIARAVRQLDPHSSPAQEQRVQIIQQAASRVSAGASPLEPVINTSLRAAANALESVVRDRFPEHGEFVTLSQRFGEDVDRLDGVHGGLHQLNTATAVGRASDLISQMTASLTPPQPTTAPTTTPAGNQ